jgi:hypothetical protein
VNWLLLASVLVPTAQTSLVDIAVTAAWLLTLVGEGEATAVHALPFQCSVKVRLLFVPTAHTSFDEIAATASARPVAGLASVTILHAVPFQCWTRAELEYMI